MLRFIFLLITKYMEIWFLFAIVSIFTSGLHNFTLKVAAENKYNISILNIYSFLIVIVCIGFYLALNIDQITLSLTKPILILSSLSWLLFYLWMFSRIEALKNVDTVIFFPLYKTFWPIIVTMISIFFFHEQLEIKEILWIILWVSIPILLVTNSEKKKQINLMLWLILIIITSILSAIGSWISKEVMIQEYNVALYLFITSIFWFIFSVISYKLSKNKQKNSHKSMWKLSLLSWILYLSSYITFMYALQWNLAIVFTINSFSILIPIILSIIFYKEHFDFKKWCVILLSIISILLFI